MNSGSSDNRGRMTGPGERSWEPRKKSGKVQRRKDNRRKAKDAIRKNWPE